MLSRWSRTTFIILREVETGKRLKKVKYYQASTLGKTLKEVGFIHLSFANQVKRVADFLYKGVDDLFLLKINPEKLDSVVKIESIAGTEQKFPHLYGPINTDAVEDVIEYSKTSSGSFFRSL